MGDHPGNCPGLPGGLAPLSEVYRRILQLFEEAADGLHPPDLCLAQDIGSEPRHIEGTSTKLKGLVHRGILTEPESGLFQLPWPAPPPD
ncbi:hypothetical protein [Streptomyces sp. NPDC002853]